MKISFRAARKDLLSCVVDAKTNIANLEYVEMERVRCYEEEQHRQVLAKLATIERPYRHLPDMDSWLSQYRDDRPMDRYKFLVLDGPSRVGKTRFVQNKLVSNPATALILDCADAVVPALKGNFSRQEHKLIMFDEAHAEMVIRCKKLFQASVNPTTYGSSPTNVFVHTVWLHGIKLVIGSNVWQQELRQLPKAQAEWIQENSVYIPISTPLWIE